MTAAPARSAASASATAAGCATRWRSPIPSSRHRCPSTAASPTPPTCRRSRRRSSSTTPALDERVNAGWPAYEAALKANGKTYEAYRLRGRQPRLPQRHHSPLRRGGGDARVGADPRLVRPLPARLTGAHAGDRGGPPSRIADGEGPMTIRNLDAALEPRAIAVVGDGPRAEAVLANLAAAGFRRAGARASASRASRRCPRRPTSPSSRRRPRRFRRRSPRSGRAAARWRWC